MADYGERVAWQPERPKFKPLHLLVSWFFTALALCVAAVVSVLNGFSQASTDSSWVGGISS